MKNSYFKTKANNKFFNKNGFLLIEFLSEDDVSKLLVYLQKVKIINNGFHSVKDISDEKKIKANSDFILNICQNKIESLLNDYHAVLGSFLVKKRKSGVLGIHMDAPFSDELQSETLNIWIPLVDINKNNGVINILPKSHKLPKYPRTFPVSEFPQEEETLILLKQKLVPITMKKGQALIFPLSLIHNSSANLSNFDRPAISIACIQNGKTFRIWKKENSKFSLYEYGNIIDVILEKKSGKKVDNLPNQIFQSDFEKYSKELKYLLENENVIKKLFRRLFER